MLHPYINIQFIFPVYNELKTQVLFAVFLISDFCSLKMHAIFFSRQDFFFFKTGLLYEALKPDLALALYIRLALNSLLPEYWD